MSELRETDTAHLSVSIVSGPAADALLATLQSSPRTTVETPAGAGPDEVIAWIRNLAAQRDADNLVIRCEPDRPPMAYASLFATGEQTHSGLNDVAHLRMSAFAIETAMFLDALLDRAANAFPATFMAEQMEFVDRIVFGGDSPEFALAKSIALALNPRAAVSRIAAVDDNWWRESPQRPFDFNESLAGAGWRRLLESEAEAAAPNSRVTSLGYSASRPFHPERFEKFLRQKSQSVFRAKGFFWLASRMNEVGGLNLAGADLHCSSAGSWWATRDVQSRESEMPDHARKQWKEPYGDRRQTFGIMALDVARATLQSALDDCLLTDDEMSEGPESWQHLPDPFPSWSHHHHHHSHDDGHDCGCGHEHDHEHDHHHEHDHRH